jgi:hypothetical protein
MDQNFGSCLLKFFSRIKTETQAVKKRHGGGERNLRSRQSLEFIKQFGLYAEIKDKII